MWKTESTRGWTRIVLVLVCVGIDFAGSQLAINVRNQGGDIVQENIFANVTDDTVSLEFQRSDGTLITQVVDFRNFEIVNYCRHITGFRMMRSSAFETMKRGADEIRKRRLQENFIDAAFVSNLGKVMYCVKHGVDVNVLGTSDMLWHNGTAALHLLAEKGDVTIGKYLLEIPNIQVDVRNAFGFTPLILACLANRRKFVRMLLKKGANPNYPNRCGKTPLHYCAQAPAFGIMFDLVHFKANVNVMDAFENTPFSLSVLDLTNLSMAKYLLKCGADLELENHKSLPLFIAVCLKCKVVEDIEAVIFLLTAGVNVNFKDQNGLTGLHVSALTNYLPLAMNLVKHGADISMVDSRSRTAFDVAKAHDNREVAQFLVDHQMLQDEPGKVRSLRKRSVTFNDQATADFDFKEL